MTYKSSDDSYKAYLKKNIFDDLIFSDSRNNQITFKKKYIDTEFGNSLFNDSKRKIDFSLHIIQNHKWQKNYEANYSIDIFDNIIIGDNLNKKNKTDVDIVDILEEKNKFSQIDCDIKRQFNGTFEYRSYGETATLINNEFNSWEYKDSSGNNFSFSERTWENLKNRFGSKEDIFCYLIHELLLN